MRKKNTGVSSVVDSVSVYVPKCPEGALAGVERPALPRGVGAISPHTNHPFFPLLYPYKIYLSYCKYKYL